MGRFFDDQGWTTAAPVFLAAAHGFSQIPEGTIRRVMWMSGEHFSYADGVVQADLPEGKATLEVVKDFDYLPASLEMNIRAVETSWLDVHLRKLEGMNAKG